MHHHPVQAAKKAAVAAAGTAGRLAQRSSYRTCVEPCGTTSLTALVTDMKHSSYLSMWHV